MELLCKVYDRSIIENRSDYMEYLATMRTKIDKSFYKKLTNKNIYLDEVDKILNDYVTIHNKKFNSYFIKCEFIIESDKNFTSNIETKYFHSEDTENIKNYLFYHIDCFTSRVYQVYNISHMSINTISDRCNLTHGDYLKQPMHAVERRINMNIDKNLQMMNSFNN